MIIGLVGFVSSGKGSVGEYLADQGFYKDEFARSLKDCVSIIFGWDRRLLEGDTIESREWREKVDEKWSSIMGREITPRLMLQEFGTDVCHKFISPLVWVETVLSRRTDQDTVITDCRFKTEIDYLRSRGGHIIRIKRGEDPWWLPILENIFPLEDRKYFMSQFNIHRSEWDWVGTTIDGTIENDGTLEDLYRKVEVMINEVGGRSAVIHK